MIYLLTCQHGFRARRSCETQLVTLVHELSEDTDRGRQTDMIILVFSKAFDHVPHIQLLAKIHHYGIRGPTYNGIRSFLKDINQLVVVDGATSDKVQVVRGVPQDTVLGPLLFLMFINDLPDTVTSNTRRFADDCIIYRTVKSIQDCLQLQEDLRELATWKETWGMLFYPDKCNVLRITQARSPVFFDYSLKNQTLEAEKQSKYLGVDISSNRSWNQHIDRIVKKGNSMIGFLQNNLRVSNRDTKSLSILHHCPAKHRVLRLSMESTHKSRKEEDRNGPASLCSICYLQISEYE